MNQHKAIHILRSFSEEEMERFILFMRSPFYNIKRSVVKIAKAIRKTSPSLSDDELSQVLFSATFPGKSYTYPLLGEVLSRLYDLELKFLDVIDGERESALRRLQAGFQCIMRGLGGEAEEIRQDAIKIAEQLPYRDNEYYYAQFLIAMLDGILKQDDICDIEPIITTQKMLDIWYIQWKLYLLALQKSKKEKARLDVSVSFEGLILEALKGHEYLNIPIVGLNFYAVMLNSDSVNTEQYFEKFSVLFYSNIRVISPADRSFCFNIIHNYLFLQYHVDQDQYLLKAFEFLRFAEGYDFFHEYRVISVNNFNDTVRLALDCNKIEWAEQFIERYAPRLMDNVRKQTIDIAWAGIECCRGNYHRAMSLLSNIRRIKGFDYIHVQWLWVRLFFEQGDWENVQQYSNYIARHIKRNREAADQYSARIKKLLYFVKKMRRAYLSAKRITTGDLKKLRDEISTASLYNKQWVIRQLEKLEERVNVTT